MRTIVDIPDNILKDVDSLAEDEDISRAEAVRRAVAEYVEKRRSARGDSAFGIWKSKRIDALAYEDELRGEWGR
jgi:metal-responsive CopG/Arc/MetJ family transcriptional regulator